MDSEATLVCTSSAALLQAGAATGPLRLGSPAESLR